MRIQFTKMSGGGNDFVVIDNRQGLLPYDLPALAKRLCDRRSGVGADGLLVLTQDPSRHFRMRYFNADGSVAAMCGNGARCMARFANLLGVAPSLMNFTTDAGPLTAIVGQNEVEISMMNPTCLKTDLTLKATGKTWKADYAEVGVPHAVIVVPDIKRIDVTTIGREIRNHKAFKPKGTNVNFVQIKNSKTLLVRTYERGVEEETLACGTGVTASALVLGLRGKVKSPVAAVTRGGETLRVSFVLQGKNFAEVRLAGPAQIIYSGEIEI